MATDLEERKSIRIYITRDARKRLERVSKYLGSPIATIARDGLLMKLAVVEEEMRKTPHLRG